MKKVMCFGTFDGMHKGHEFYLTEAKKKGDYLVVVVALDETVNEVKGRRPKLPASERASLLRQLGIADKVLIGNPGDKLMVIIDERPDIIALGYDQTSFTERLQQQLNSLGLNPEIIRLPAFQPEVYKSSKLWR